MIKDTICFVSFLYILKNRQNSVLYFNLQLTMLYYECRVKNYIFLY